LQLQLCRCLEKRSPHGIIGYAMAIFQQEEQGNLQWRTPCLSSC
jgi:hypothetical protein